MKIALFLMIMGICSLSASSSYAQSTKLTLNLKNVKIKDLFNEIKKESNISFLYNNDELDDNQVVTLNVKQQSVEDILDVVLIDKGLRYEIKDNFILVYGANSGSRERLEQQAKRKIKGVVTDEMGEPITGASVVIVGTTLGTLTGIDGSFELDAASIDELKITFIGYKPQQIKVGSKQTLNLVLAEDAVLVDEVIVVGYGVQKKVTMTGAVVALKGEEIVKSPSLNVANSLIGRLPGVIINNRSGQPGKDDPSILIRGRSTTGDASPLIIIDGIERGGLGQLNPNDIASVSVLKDASAAIYGARAANGVILVTTKRGTNEKPKIELSFNQGFTQATRNPRMADSYTFASVYNEIEEGAGRPARYTPVELQKFKDGSDPNYANTDWYDTTVKSLAAQHQTNLSVSGGADRAKYFLSFGEAYQGGPFEDGSMKTRQYNLRSNVDVKVTDWLDVGFNLAGRFNKNHYPVYDEDTYAHIYLYLPTWTKYWPGTDLIRPNRGSESLQNRVTDASGTKDTNTKVFQSSFTFDIKVPKVDGLTASGSFGYDASSVHQKDLRTPSYVYYKDETTGEYNKGLSGVSPSQASLSERITQYSFLYLNLKLNYLRTFGDHTVGGLLGYEQSKSESNFLFASRNDFLSPSIPQISAGSSDKNKQSNDGGASEGARQNVYGRLSYDYLSRYMVEFTFRVDGSPNFPKKKRFGFFPSASAGWRISEEKFMQQFDFLDNLKLRASYGRMGNDRVNAFQYLTMYGYGKNYVIGNNDVSGLVQSGIPNPNITWEVADTYNAGIETRFWNGLLGIDLDVFKTSRSNILAKRDASIPEYTGLILPEENIGKMNNKGFELTLTHQQAKRDFKYFLSGSVSFARNKITYMDEKPAAEAYQLQTGKPIGSGLYYKALGIFSTEEDIKAHPHLLNARPGDVIYEDVNKDGVIDSRDMVRNNKSPVPEVVYSLSASVEYKNFDVSVLLQGQERAEVTFTEYFRSMSNGVGNFTSWRAEDRWTPENINGSMPRADLSRDNVNTYNSTLWLFNAGFLRLKNIELGYSLPKSICNKVRIENIRFYASAHNLFVIYDHMKDVGLDPEATSYWYYPPQKIFNFGVNLTF